MTTSQLAYTVLPPDEDSNLPRIKIATARDTSEYEFSNVRITGKTLWLISAQAHERLQLARSVVALMLLPEGDDTTSIRKRLWRMSNAFMAREDLLNVHCEWLRDIKQDAVCEVGGSEAGASWGNGIRSFLGLVKKIEGEIAMVLTVAALERFTAGVEADDMVRIAEYVASLKAAQEGN